jgi:hypothetical protein
VREAMLVAMAGVWPEPPELPADCCVADVVCAGAVVGERAGAGAVLVDAGLHATKTNAARTPTERSRRIGID